MSFKTTTHADTWTDPCANYQPEFDGAFSDGFDATNSPFGAYKIVLNCNCIFQYGFKGNKSYDYDINITNKHHAIVFYKGQIPVRLMLINQDTDIKTCIEKALQQPFDENQTFKDLYQEKGIREYVVDLGRKPIFNKADATKEIEVGSCDRINLLYSMLNGNVKEDDNKCCGVYQLGQWNYIPNIFIKIYIRTDTERFVIPHYGAFINKARTMIIPIQKKSSLYSNPSLQEVINECKAL